MGHTAMYAPTGTFGTPPQPDLHAWKGDGSRGPRPGSPRVSFFGAGCGRRRGC
jgi:hypothetical protein